MKIETLTLENFQGIDHLRIELGGRSAVVSAANGVGKSTLANAWAWLLIEKDAQGRGDFLPKPRDGEGAELHNLETSVEATIGSNGRQIILRKDLTEKWTARRGSASKEFTGHASDCYVDGVPTKKREFQSTLIELFGSEEQIRLLTSPFYFSSEKPHGLGWVARRALLFEVCGGVSDEEVIASDPAFAELPHILNGRSAEDHRKIIDGQRRKVRDKREEIPVRIREVQHGKPSLPEGCDVAAEEAKKDAAKTEIERLQQERAKLEAGGMAAEWQREMAEIDTQIAGLRREHEETIADILKDKRAEVEAEETALRKAKAILPALEAAIAEREGSVIAMDEKLDSLRAGFRETKAAPIGEKVCSLCNVPTPLEFQEAAKERELAEINCQGKKLAAERAGLGQEIEAMRAKHPELVATTEDHGRKIEAFKAEIEVIKSRPVTIPEEITSRKKEIEKKTTNIQTDFSPIFADLSGKIVSQQQIIQAAETALQNVRLGETADQRIDELKATEKRYSAELEDIERHIYLMDQFTRAKAALLDEHINSRFTTIRFQLFREQINGGLEECCDPMIGGVPFSDGASNSERINAGLEIIETLSEHFGVKLPVFVDNSEACNRLFPLKGQIIALAVSEDREIKIALEEESHEHRIAS